MHMQPARGLRHVAATQFVDTLDVLQRTRSADMGFSGGFGLASAEAESAAMISSASAGFDR